MSNEPVLAELKRLSQRMDAAVRRMDVRFARLDRRLSGGFARTERRFNALESMLYSVIRFATGTEAKVSALVTKAEPSRGKPRPT